MQTSDSYNQKNSLFNAMNRFIVAVNNMDQTVMVPSLLRDVPLDGREDLKTAETSGTANGTVANGTTANGTGANGTAYFHGDMYGSYVLLKSIRNDIKWGILQGDEWHKEKVEVEEGDLEKQFHFHLNGLHVVLSKLTDQAKILTNRYKEEIGCGN